MLMAFTHIGGSFMRKQKVPAGTLRQEFQKDLELFKYFLLLLNDSSPIRNVELMWKEELDPLKAEYKEHVSTGEALVQLQPNGGALSGRNSPSTLFCDYVHGFGAYEHATCARSDVPAKQRCEANGCSEVYGCHVGLTDIAVPVICDGEYLGTLFSGQVLSSPPTAAGFAVVRKNLEGQAHIDFAKLEAAYYQVPVVTQAQLAEAVRILELFARYIANSWNRLQIMGDLQRVRDRECALNRKELAAILLSGELGDRQDLAQLAANAGIDKLPERVMVLRTQQRSQAGELRPQIANSLNMSRLCHVVEDLCQHWNNTLTISGRPGELCIFLRQVARNSRHGHLSLQEMAESVLATVKMQGMDAVRVGISAVHEKPEDLLRAYHEACAALDGGSMNVCFYEDLHPVTALPGQSLSPLIKAIQQGQGVDAAVRDLFARNLSSSGHALYLQQSRAYLTWAMEHLALEMISVGAEAQAVTATKEQGIVEILSAPNPFILCESFRKFAEMLAQEVAWSFSQRENKIVSAVHRLVAGRGVARLTIHEIASELKMSSGHLSRLYSRTTGMTLEEYLIRQRVELAKRMLLDPRLNVAEVAERCGFCNSAYFASVFKKYAHCTPRGFASHPHLWQPFAPAEPTRVSPAD
jgi:AraC-like DNA-binding protein/ligand-binding sensor protein